MRIAYKIWSVSCFKNPTETARVILKFISRNAYENFWSENVKGRDHLEDQGMDDRIILEWISRK
jgi:hypothetical protein